MSGEELQIEQRLIEVTEAHKRALRQLAKRDAAREELGAAVYQAARDEALSITIPPVPKPKATGKKGDPQIHLPGFVVWLSGDGAAQQRNRLVEVAQPNVDFAELTHHGNVLGVLFDCLLELSPIGVKSGFVA
jgi:hypothetical protein